MIERQKTKYVTLKDYLSAVDISIYDDVFVRFIKDDKLIKIKSIKDLTDNELNMLVSDFYIVNLLVDIKFLNIRVLYKEYNINNEDIDESDDEYYQFEEVD